MMSGRIVSLPNGHDGIVVNGATFALDRKVDSPLLKASLPNFRDAYPDVPESRWDESDQFATFNSPVLYQVQNGCVGHGGCTAFWNCWVAAGNDPVDFSPTWLYALINGGRDQGAQIGDLIAAARGVGVATADVFPESKYMLGGAAEKAARPVAANYQLEDGYQISTWAEKGTALHMGYQVADSVMVGDDFMRSLTTINGYALVPVDRGQGNHCVAAGGLIRFKGKVYSIKQNSWGTGTPLGPHGRFLTSQEHDTSQGWGYSGVVFRTVKRKPGSDPLPRPAVA